MWFDITRPQWNKVCCLNITSRFFYIDQILTVLQCWTKYLHFTHLDIKSAYNTSFFISHVHISVFLFIRPCQEVQEIPLQYIKWTETLCHSAGMQLHHVALPLDCDIMFWPCSSGTYPSTVQGCWLLNLFPLYVIFTRFGKLSKCRFSNTSDIHIWQVSPPVVTPLKYECHSTDLTDWCTKWKKNVFGGTLVTRTPQTPSGPFY